MIAVNLEFVIGLWMYFTEVIVASTQLSKLDLLLIEMCERDSTFYFFFFQTYQARLTPMQMQISRLNSMANNFQDANIVLSHFNVNRLEDLNSR